MARCGCSRKAQMPKFPLKALIYYQNGMFPTNPLTGPPDAVCIAHLNFPTQGFYWDAGAGILVPFGIYSIWIPAETPVHTRETNVNGDFIELVRSLPFTTRRLYEALYADEVAAGFPNEFKQVVVRHRYVPGFWTDAS